MYKQPVARLHGTAHTARRREEQHGSRACTKGHTQHSRFRFSFTMVQARRGRLDGQTDWLT